MTTPDSADKSDVVLAADVGSYSMTTLSLAVQMAASMDTRLRGLFVEDEDLLQMTGLPITREISLTTARERPTDVERMQRAMRAVARQFEQALKQEASALHIGWSFDYVRGRVRDLGLTHGADVTYLILGQPVSHRLRSHPERAPRRILLVANRSPHQKRALEVVMQRFDHEKIELTLVIDDNAEATLAAELMQSSQVDGDRLRLHQLDRKRFAEQLAHRASGFDCAIVSRHEDPELLGQILKTLSCPVILVA